MTTPATTDRSSAPVVLFAVACLALVVAGMLNQPALFGVLLWLALMLCAVLGLSSDRLRGRTLAWLAALGTLSAALTLAIFALDDPGGRLHLWGGLPRATAVLVYGIWPSGLLLGALYGLCFDSEVLDPERLQRFQQRFGKQRAS
jgi:hypothetical protein